MGHIGWRIEIVTLLQERHLRALPLERYATMGHSRDQQLSCTAAFPGQGLLRHVQRRDRGRLGFRQADWGGRRIDSGHLPGSSGGKFKQLIEACEPSKVVGLLAFDRSGSPLYRVSIDSQLFFSSDVRDAQKP